MTNVIETIERDGWRLTFHYDDDGEACNPRDWDGAGLFLGFPHRNYDIGDERVDPREIERPCPTCDGDGYSAPDEVCETCGGTAEIPVTSMQELSDELMRRHNGYRIWPVGMIDHSGVHYYIGGGAHFCDPGGWDSGTCGFLIYTREKLAEWAGEGWETHYTDEQLDEMAKAEIEEYGAWANGEVYGYVIEQPPGLAADYEDSCWGFVGWEFVKREAEAALDAAMKRAAEDTDTENAAAALEVLLNV